jgi:hypothetical protein
MNGFPATAVGLPAVNCDRQFSEGTFLRVAPSTLVFSSKRSDVLLTRWEQGLWRIPGVPPTSSIAATCSTEVSFPRKMSRAAGTPR